MINNDKADVISDIVKYQKKMRDSFIKSRTTQLSKIEISPLLTERPCTAQSRNDTIQSRNDTIQARFKKPCSRSNQGCLKCKILKKDDIVQSL